MSEPTARLFEHKSTPRNIETGIHRGLRCRKPASTQKSERHRGRNLVTALASCADKRSSAERLIRERYASCGYRVLEMDSLERERDGQDFVLVAERRGQTVGTLTVGMDGPQGLLSESAYGDVVARARLAGHRLCEFTRFAVAQSVEDGRAVIGSLFEGAYAVCRSLHGATHAFIEVNPRHVAFYRRAFGFVVASGERFCERAMAPAVLLLLELEPFERRLGHVVAEMG